MGRTYGIIGRHRGHSGSYGRHKGNIEGQEKRVIRKAQRRHREI